jgi:hypothetical protein
MDKIRDILAKDVDRDIDGVIKADDLRRLAVEVDEYVITKEILPKLERLLEEYVNPGSSNGVWISGFFGSGKSHLLKMLALLLANETIGGKTVAEQFLLKKEIADEAMFQATLAKAAAIPAKSILFNIDQKSDAIGGDPDAALLEVFAKVLNQTQGFYYKLDYIAQFERDLFKQGQLEAFKALYAEESGSSWEAHLDDIDTIKNPIFARVYAKFYDNTVEEGLKFFDRLRDKHKLSVEGLADRVKDYLATLPDHARVNFFVDEVGQFIGRRSKLMLNLQTVAETLATKCDGRAWIFVTSQGKLESVIGKLDEGLGNDISKITGRFAIRPTLTSANVAEVIQKRLLAKKESAQPTLEALYETEKENLRTLFTFGDGSRDYKGFQTASDFSDYAPFHLYQFDLFQESIEQLSKHDAFIGKHTAVGERSMLSVFQQVAKKIADLPINTFATFDLMFEGLSNVLRGDFQRSVKTAEKNLSADHPLAVRILKSLFLLKYVPEFKSTPRNVSILLIERPDIDIAAHEKAVKIALNYLHAQHYLQKSSDAYEFLTDEEKDIEVDIKNTEVGDDVVSKLLDRVLFQDVIGDAKIRYEANGQHYPFGRRIDSGDYGKAYDLSIHIATPDHHNAGNLRTLMAQNTGTRELLIILPNDRSLIEDAKLFEQTKSYIQKKTSSSLSDSKQQIVHGRSAQNGSRRSQMVEQAKDLLAQAEFVINGSKVEVTGQDPRVRIGKAFQELIHFVYPNLRMLKADYKETMIPQILEEQNDLISESMSEAEQEVLTLLQRKKLAGDPVVTADVLKHFRHGNYGWPDAATLCLMARLFRRHKIELKRGAEVLDQDEVAAALCNSAHYGGVYVQIQEAFDVATIAALKNFHHDFFHKSNPENDAKSAANALLKALSEEAAALDTLIARKSDFPFVTSLEPIRDRIRKISEHDYNYPLKNLRDFEDALLDAKEDWIDPIKSFISGSNGQSFCAICEFLRDQASNLSHGDPHVKSLRAVASSETPFRGNLLSTGVSALNALKDSLAHDLQAARASAVADIETRENTLRAHPDFAKLAASQAEQVLQPSERMKLQIQSETLLPVIAERLRDYLEGGFAQQLDAILKAATAATAATAAKAPAPTGVTYDNDKDDDGGQIAAEASTPTYQPIQQIVKSTASQGGKVHLNSEAEVDAFLGELSKQLKQLIAEGKGITL